MVTGTGTLTLQGSAASPLTGNSASNYSGGLSIIGNGTAGSTLQFNAVTAFGSATSGTATAASSLVLGGISGGKLRYIGTTPFSTAKLFTIPASGIGIIDDPNATAGFSFTNTGAIASSASSTLTLNSAATNSSTFAPQLTAGILSINNLVPRA